MRRTPAILLVACTGIVGVLDTPAHGDLVAYEGFDYGPLGSDLLGGNGGLGFSGAWRPGGFNASISTNFDVVYDPLTFGSLVSTEPAIRTLADLAITGITRDLAQPLGLGGTTIYISFLIQPEGLLHLGAANGFLGVVLESPGEPELFVGKPGGGMIDRFVLEDRGGSRQTASNLEVMSRATAFLVIKAEFAAAGNDRFTLYTNPTPGAAEPLTGTVKNDSNVGTVVGLTLYSTGAMRLDELRVGDTFADVTPIVPEPAGLVLLSLAVAALAVVRRAAMTPTFSRGSGSWAAS